MLWRIRRKAPIYSIDLDQGIASTVQDQLDLTHAIPLLKETMKLLKNVLWGLEIYSALLAKGSKD
ncbi:MULTISPECIES: hypothetical protein [Vibrio]|uniref:Uncharacterized protein n=1 Tax=Vibrio cortegadensis TaxID=1328770 RepID=A0ABV4M8R8_9VIBR|nr:MULTISPECIES: hypothetical protein [Vibrio]NOH83806.1 hypothetical protein [Vibrio sp. 03-59-1]RBW65085.1 hypothetical protein DS893_11570 [Vibrionales bacterium C3R12]TKF21132.1 hypothetical protein FCV43_12065 [Vibrio genomosp. F6]